MKHIVLAAGYATRLYPLTEHFPKPLLEVGGRTILDRLMSDVDTIKGIDEHIVVTNHRFIGIFEQWRAQSSYRHPITLIDDGSEDNDHRIGAVKDLLLAIEQRQIEDDMLVLAADNVVDFSFRDFVAYANEKGASCITCHHEDSLPALQKTGVVCLDESQRVVLMEEKPQKPKSHWAVPPFYVYKRKDLPLIKTCMEHGCGFDAPGNLAHYLCEQTAMYAYHITGNRYDIGDLQSYEAVKKLPL